MRVLFYIVHPSKYHLFRITINELKKQHHVDVIINSKDVLENLIKSEGWKYTNIFPKGRNVSSKPSIIKSALKFILTVLRLEYYLFNNKNYDVFVTDDALVVNGWLRCIPSFIFNDNDIETIKINKILFYFAKHIITPSATEIGVFKKKKIAFRGVKSLAHLHPNVFKPNINNLLHYQLTPEEYCIIRISNLNATHDIGGNNGINEEDIDKMLLLFSKKKKIIIVSEKIINPRFDQFLFKGNPTHMVDLLYYSAFLVCDSGTMAQESAVLGVPTVIINKLCKKLGVFTELKNYGLLLFFDNFSDAWTTINDFYCDEDLKAKLKDKICKYLDYCDDFNSIMLKVILVNGTK